MSWKYAPLDPDTLMMADQNGKRYPIMILALLISRGLETKEGILDPYERSLNSFIESMRRVPPESEFFIQMAEVWSMMSYFRKKKWPELHDLGVKMDLVFAEPESKPQ